MTTLRVPPSDTPQRPGRRRHWLRWILASAAAFVVLLVVTAAIAVKLQPTPAPLALPAPAAAPAGPLDGAWRVASGSVAGFRIQQTVLALTSEVVGRTEDVTGTATIAGGTITSATIRVNLLALTSGGRPAPQFGKSLETQRYPDATISLAQPADLDSSFISGAVTTITATGQLTLHAVTRTLTVRLSARRDAANVEVTASIPIAFRDWTITLPTGYGILGSLADHGTAEFLLVLQRS